MLLCGALAAAAMAACGDGDDATSTSMADGETTLTSEAAEETTLTSPAEKETTLTSEAADETTSSPAAVTATVESLVAAVQARLDDEFAAAPDPPSQVLGAMELSCDRSGPLRAGDLLACTGTPRTEPGFELDPVGLLFAVLDDDGTVAWSTGSDLPSSRDGLDALIRTATPGLFCRDLVDPDAEADAGFFSATTTNESLGYFLSVVYWFIEERPDRMDEDRNGVPCETVHDPDVVATIWSGGEVG